MREPDGFVGTETPADHAPRAANVPWMAMVPLIAPAAVLGAAASAASFLVQTSGTFDAATITWLVAGLALAEAGGAASAGRVRAMGVVAQAGLACVGLAVAAMGWAFTSATPLAAIALALLAGLASPLRATAIQRAVGEGARARAASAAHACDMALSVSILPAAGWWSASRRRG